MTTTPNDSIRTTNKLPCDHVQGILAEQGPGGLRDDLTAQEHLESCTACFEMLEAQAALDEALAALPAYDASDDLVATLLDRPELTAAADPPPGPTSALHRLPSIGRILHKLPSGSTRTRLALAASALLALTLLLQLPTFDRQVQDQMASSEPVVQAARREPIDELEAVGYLDDGTTTSANAAPNAAANIVVRRLEIDEKKADLRTDPTPAGPLPARARALGDLAAQIPEPVARPSDKIEGKGSGLLEFQEEIIVDDIDVTSEAPSSKEPSLRSSIIVRESEEGHAGTFSGSLSAEHASPAPPVWIGTDADTTFRGGSPTTESETEGPFDGEGAAEAQKRIEERLRNLPRARQYEEWLQLPRARQPKEQQTKDSAEVGSNKSLESRDDSNAEHNGFSAEYYGSFVDADSVATGKRAKKKERLAPQPVPVNQLQAREAARQFLAEREQIEGLETQPAEGYWSNTYVPGDPALRQLQARLLGATPEGSANATLLDLHNSSRRPVQPFDVPENAALGVYLHADRTGLEGPGRMMIQVGLQGSERRGGRRPAMNLALVLDLPPTLGIEEATSLRALVQAFGQTRDLGDRFRLIVAGRPGGLAIDAEAFRHGPLTVTMERLLGSGEPLDGPSLDLGQALEVAFDAVHQGDDPTAPLGSSAVVLVTATAVNSTATNSTATNQTLAQVLHQQAVRGIPTSVVAIGKAPLLEDMQRLALAGQGNLRLLHSAADADALVDRELSAVSRTVARALRLRIRLAPGVELVGISGSSRLDENQAERTRQAEQAIDQRLSRNLGIESDRGDDEEGLQILIPSLLAGDSHVVLLDVIASGPGAIADVQVRYKDLVHLDNGVARARLTLGREIREPGALELNVTKNLLARQLRETLDEAGGKARIGDPTAASLLADYRRLLEGLTKEIPGLATDPDLARDIDMLRQYEAALAAGSADDPGLRRYLGDSLQFAALLKVLPRPAAPDSAQ